MAGLGGAAIPDRRLGEVRRSVAVANIEVADPRGGFRLARHGGATQPGLGFGQIGLAERSVHQRGAISGLRGGQAFFRGAAEQLERADGIARRPDAALRQYAEQMDRRRQFRVGRLLEISDDLGARRVVGSGARQATAHSRGAPPPSPGRPNA